MFKDRVRTSEEALVYITDCTLATVSGMAMTKSRKKGEYQRQIAIAQTAIDWIKPCPFCGGEAVWCTDHHVACGNESCALGLSEFLCWPDQWNTRAPATERVTEAQAREAYRKWVGASDTLYGERAWLAALKWAGKIGDKP